jgi:hypothetical protein
MVRYTKTAYPTDTAAKPKVEDLGCVAHGWDAAKFLFLSDNALTTKLCSTDAKPAR